MKRRALSLVEVMAVLPIVALLSALAFGLVQVGLAHYRMAVRLGDQRAEARHLSASIFRLASLGPYRLEQGQQSMRLADGSRLHFADGFVFNDGRRLNGLRLRTFLLVLRDGRLSVTMKFAGKERYVYDFPRF